ncbi:MAG: terminase TerL endonuclease subunit, partial [Raoultibacter sp.]
GLLTVTGGEGDFKNNYKFIISHLKKLKEEYGLTFVGIGIDPHNADGFLSDLEEFGCPVMLVTQSARNLNDATEDIRLLVKEGSYLYDKSNELMSWSFSNAKLVYNSFDECKVDKKYGRFKRIDPVDACVDAHFIRLKQVEESEHDVNKTMEDYLTSMGW